LLKNEIICPICHHTVPLLHFSTHLKIQHSLKIPKFKVKPKITILTPAQEWGKPFWEIGRTLIPEEKWETEDVYNLENNCILTDEAGNPTPFPNPTEMIYKTVDELRRNGIRPQYIRIDREKILVQASGSPIPAWAVYLIIVAVVAVLFGVAFYLVAESFYRIFIAPIPPEWRPYVIGGIVIVALIVAVGMFIRKS